MTIKKETKDLVLKDLDLRFKTLKLFGLSESRLRIWLRNNNPNLLRIDFLQIILDHSNTGIDLKNNLTQILN